LGPGGYAAGKSGIMDREPRPHSSFYTEIITEAFMITVNLYYKGINGNARAFAEEMESSGIADAIRAEEGNLRYQYFQPIGDSETVLLIDSWTDQAAIDAHHASSMMKQLADLRDKYDLHMTVERFVSDEYEADGKFIRE
jgi:Uncharacterized conserved protein